jgi:hypothetical protein
LHYCVLVIEREAGQLGFFKITEIRENEEGKHVAQMIEMNDPKQNKIDESNNNDKKKKGSTSKILK